MYQVYERSWSVLVLVHLYWRVKSVYTLFCHAQAHACMSHVPSLVMHARQVHHGGVVCGRGSCRDARTRNVFVCLCVCGSAFEEVADRGCGGLQGKHIKYHIKGAAVCSVCFE